MVPQKGLEPLTYALKGRSSTNWATGAFVPCGILGGHTATHPQQIAGVSSLLELVSSIINITLQVGRFDVVHICSLTGHPSRLCVRTFTTSIKGTNAWRAIPTNIYDTTWLKPRRKVRASRDGRRTGGRTQIMRLSVARTNQLYYPSI